MTRTISSEDYLKSIYLLSELSDPQGRASTTQIAERLEIRPASVTDMLKKLSDKDLISYVKYKGVSLTEKGRLTAVDIIRRHRLW
ncbi:MAG: metal-dependent transcriptional regulator, partial [Chloroflexota bacterium]